MSTVADLRIPRHARILHADGPPDERTLAEWRAAEANVLLGDTGSGKSGLLRAKAEAVNGVFVAQSTLRSNAEAVADDEHAHDQLRIEGRPVWL